MRGSPLLGKGALEPGSRSMPTIGRGSLSDTTAAASAATALPAAVLPAAASARSVSALAAAASAPMTSPRTLVEGAPIAAVASTAPVATVASVATTASFAKGSFASASTLQNSSALVVGASRAAT